MSTLALCIPAYNAAAYLPRLLQSAQAQTQAFDEIWVYDDCSRDETAAVARSLGAQVVSGEVNRGCSHGKNILAQRTHCDWIHFHDADDDLTPDFVATAHTWMQQAEAPDVVLFAYEARDYDSNKRLYERQFDDAALRQDAIAYSIREQINPFCGLYRREAMLRAGGYDTDPQVLYNEDVAFHCRLAIAGLHFAAESRVTVINYCRANSMSSGNLNKCLQAQYQVMKKVSEQVAPCYWPAIGQRLWAIAAVSAAQSDWSNADACVTLAQQLGKPQGLPLGMKQLATYQPGLALRLREYLIRGLKPHLRSQRA
ncbi:glycosyltransferase family 2 protein [Lyngbya confervoides]|uniref:Glycosyltransferase family 2 protein n=1 Tax=Lyngbya confervoides BDU141951 TaxID=1574623 RepID=A0ABD4SZL9_9CYAN|nr:glycosyltransferase family A protein [Lyngbya confervoides]MCM1981757.1 glycosyltransferase family 2 protein [Lyngbya confervoides BDU141951]